tara:strand:- start:96 stop:674 length:579 start_codon:yes stop_codon:yes gene_type:complete
MELRKNFLKKINNLKFLLSQLKFQSKKLELAINKSVENLKKGGKLLICGNGGSAADSEHLAAEFIVRLKPNINRNPIPALPLTMNTPIMTACSNDYDFKKVFLRSFKAFYKDLDILIVFSTSGKSKNLIELLKYAKKKKTFIIGFLGKKNSECEKFCSISINIDSKEVDKIQECHIFLAHFFAEEVEKKILI